MKGSLAELIEQAQNYRLWLQLTLRAQAQEIADLRAAGVSEARIRALYPLNMDEYEDGFALLITRLKEPANFKTLKKLSSITIGSLENYLPSEMVDNATQYRSNLYSHVSHLRMITYYCHELADFDPALEISPGESLQAAEDAWSDALQFFGQIAAWLEEALPLT